jgi:hypothetical protein
MPRKDKPKQTKRAKPLTKGNFRISIRAYCFDLFHLEIAALEGAACE